MGAGDYMWLDGWRQNVEDKIQETEQKRVQRIREIEKEFNKQLRPLNIRSYVPAAAIISRAIALFSDDDSWVLYVKRQKAKP